MKKVLKLTWLIFFFYLFFLGVCLFPHQSLAYVFSGLDTSLDLESPHYIQECEAPYGGEVEYTWDPPSTYTSNQIKIETSSSVFDLKIDVCNEQSGCLVPVTSGKRLIFKVKFSISSDAIAPLPGFRRTNCVTYIGVHSAPSSSSVPLPSPTSYQKFFPSSLPTQPMPTGRQAGQCHGDSDCKNYSCKYCYVGQRVCLGGYCQECISNSQCVSNTSCVASVCTPKIPPTGLKATTSLRPTTSVKKVCGNNNCEPWAGEDCLNCPQDCNNIPGFCCAPFKNYINPVNYRNKIYNDLKAEVSLIPEGMLVFPYDFTSEIYFSSHDFQICSKGKIITGSCTHNGHCPKGFCLEGEVNKCINLDKYSEEEYSIAAVKNEAVKIRESQTNYKVAYVETYKKVEDQITQKRDVSGLEVKLEVQGQTVGKIPETSVGKTAEVKLFINNITDHEIMVSSDILYEKAKGKGDAVITDNKTSASFVYLDQNGLNIGSMWGSFKTRLFGGNYFILPKKASMIVDSSISPNQVGEIKIVGTVFYTSEKKFAKIKTDLTKYGVLIGEEKFLPETQDEISRWNAFESNMQKIQLEQKLKVNPKKCGFFGC